MLEQNTQRLMALLAGMLVLGGVLYLLSPYMEGLQETMKELFFNRPHKF